MGNILTISLHNIIISLKTPFAGSSWSFGCLWGAEEHSHASGQQLAETKQLAGGVRFGQPGQHPIPLTLRIRVRALHGRGPGPVPKPCLLGPDSIWVGYG